ncbi:G-protein coupled receptor 54-like [Amphiura filiformis]|uniref:G-protein coupled receptor 54-like n=1 Tax=Amphiura filiformis TaxID=82378 RepID=UPI003B217C87
MASLLDIPTSSGHLTTDQSMLFSQPEFDYLTTTSVLESNEFSEEAKMILTIVISIVAIFGLLGNTMVILTVLVFSDMHTLINFSFANLALTDLALLLLDAVPTATDTIGWSISAKLGCNVPIYLQYVVLQVSSLTLAFLSWDRYRLIVKPIQSLNTRSSKQIHLIVILIWIASFVIQIPAAFVPTISLETGCNEFGLPWGHGLFFAYATITLYIIPLIIIIPSYTCIALSMTKNSTSVTTKKEDAKRLAQRNKTIIWVLIVVIFYIILSLPIHVVHLWMAFDPNVTAQTPLYIEVHTAANVLLFINSSVNPYLYAFGGSSFRKHLKDITQCCCCGVLMLMRKKKRNKSNSQSDRSMCSTWL